ncbi:hypothetical protein [Photobacterium leiognathi]|uniref:hypothetical protein n=1 Tax=Photobacterium leiognathi TaxID=553611 RepID=UPI0029815EB6|nr:hypothetical protein [Photobacterium leiognathi]
MTKKYYIDCRFAITRESEPQNVVAIETGTSFHVFGAGKFEVKNVEPHNLKLGNLADKDAFESEKLKLAKQRVHKSYFAKAVYTEPSTNKEFKAVATINKDGVLTVDALNVVRLLIDLKDKSLPESICLGEFSDKENYKSNLEDINAKNDRSGFYKNCHYYPRGNKNNPVAVIAKIDSNNRGEILGQYNLNLKVNLYRSLGSTLTLGEKISESEFEQLRAILKKEPIYAGFYNDCSYTANVKSNLPIVGLTTDDEKTETYLGSALVNKSGKITFYSVCGAVKNISLLTSSNQGLTLGKKVSEEHFKAACFAATANTMLNERLADARHEITHIQTLMKTSKLEFFEHESVLEQLKDFDFEWSKSPYAQQLFSCITSVKGLRSALRCIEIIVPYLEDNNASYDLCLELAKDFDGSSSSVSSFEVAKVAFGIVVDTVNCAQKSPLLPLRSSNLEFTNEGVTIYDKSGKATPYRLFLRGRTKMPVIVDFMEMVVKDHLGDLIDYNRSSIQLHDFEVLNKLMDDELHLRCYTVFQRLNTLAGNANSEFVILPSVLKEIGDVIKHELVLATRSLVNEHTWNNHKLSEAVDKCEDFCTSLDYVPESYITDPIRPHNNLMVH